MVLVVKSDIYTRSLVSWNDPLKRYGPVHSRMSACSLPIVSQAVEELRSTKLQPGEVLLELKTLTVQRAGKSKEQTAH